MPFRDLRFAREQSTAEPHDRLKPARRHTPRLANGRIRRSIWLLFLSDIDSMWRRGYLTRPRISGRSLQRHGKSLCRSFGFWMLCRLERESIGVYRTGRLTSSGRQIPTSAPVEVSETRQSLAGYRSAAVRVFP